MFQIVKKILSPEEIIEKTPLSPALKLIKKQRDKEVSDIISGKDKRFLLIIGPCSADNEDSVCDYVKRLSRIAEKVKQKIMIVPRIYTNKPRTRGEGYKGMLHEPNPNMGTDIQEGIFSLRHMHIRAMNESGMSAADEMLYPENLGYVEDLLSYITVGARSSENQLHRLVASGINVPVGIKNPMNGSLMTLLNSIYAAQIPNEFKYQSNQVKTNGNFLAHAVLRGFVDASGANWPNYHYEDIIRFSELYAKSGLKNPSIIIDTNHSNSDKKPLEQTRIVHEIIENYCEFSDFRKFVRGLMIESYILDGNQSSPGEYGKSLTDGCLGFEKTERLIYDTAECL